MSFTELDVMWIIALMDGQVQSCSHDKACFDLVIVLCLSL